MFKEKKVITLETIKRKTLFYKHYNTWRNAINCLFTPMLYSHISKPNLFNLKDISRFYALSTQIHIVFICIGFKLRKSMNKRLKA